MNFTDTLEALLLGMVFIVLLAILWPLLLKDYIDGGMIYD